jgi:uncharacterized protein (DUF1015 family)
MAVIKSFRGVRYNPVLTPNMQAVVSQPYDRISSRLRAEYFGLSPYNISHIILGHLEDDQFPTRPDGSHQANGIHGPSDAVYFKAKAYYEDWLEKQVLMRENSPALYAYEQTFTVDGTEYVRLGMIAAVQLHEFDEGVILPHERTHTGPKEDRFKLLSTMQVNTEQIFMLYPDPENRVNALLRQAIAGRKPDIDVVEIFESAVRQRVWVITDPATIEAIEATMAPMRQLIIADGHHRYETGLNYRRARYAECPDIPANAALNYISATLVSMDDPGLVVLPTHREIRNFDGHTPAEVLERARAYFDVTPVADLDACLAAVNADPDGHAFGFYAGQGLGFQVLTLKDPAIVERLIPTEQSRDWKSLAVSIMHRILLDLVAEVPARGIEDKSMIRYHRDPHAPVENIDAGKGNFVFFLSSTRMAQIRAVASHGEKMPQKSTDFYPKMLSGIALLPVGEGECL